MPTAAQDALDVLRMELTYLADKLSDSIADDDTHPDVLMCAVAMRSKLRDLLALANPR